MDVVCFGVRFYVSRYPRCRWFATDNHISIAATIQTESMDPAITRDKHYNRHMSQHKDSPSIMQ